MSFNPFLPLFVEVKKVNRRNVVRKKSTIYMLPLDVYSPSFGAPRDRAYLSLLQNKVRNTSARGYF